MIIVIYLLFWGFRHKCKFGRLTVKGSSQHKVKNKEFHMIIKVMSKEKAIEIIDMALEGYRHGAECAFDRLKNMSSQPCLYFDLSLSGK